MVTEEGLARVNICVRGHVQGVGFRWFTERAARRLGVSGFVRNLPGGGVEVVAEGSKETLEALMASLRHGPTGADVHELTVAWHEAVGLTGFSIR